MGTNSEILEAEWARVMAALADLRDEYAALADPNQVALDDEHDSEGSTVGFERARVAGLIERTERHLAELEAAARRAAEGGYGLCARCGREIGAERLAALPAARACIGCAGAARAEPELWGR